MPHSVRPLSGRSSGGLSRIFRAAPPAPVEVASATPPPEQDGTRRAGTFPRNQRIRQPKTCPVHGKVEPHEIVSGYEYAEDHYVLIDPQEIASRPKTDRAISIASFVDAGTIDPGYFSGRNYYVLPEGDVADR